MAPGPGSSFEVRRLTRHVRLIRLLHKEMLHEDSLLAYNLRYRRSLIDEHRETNRGTK